MSLVIRPYHTHDLDNLLKLTVLAFEPIFASFARIMGLPIYTALYPDWKTVQRKLVMSLCRDHAITVWIADIEGVPVGLVAYKLDQEQKKGEIEFLVVHPDYQNGGVGTRLNEWALTKMHEAGMELVEVGTGGDESHAQARKSYEKAGFTPLPLVRYFKRLN